MRKSLACWPFCWPASACTGTTPGGRQWAADQPPPLATNTRPAAGTTELDPMKLPPAQTRVSADDIDVDNYQDSLRKLESETKVESGPSVRRSSAARRNRLTMPRSPPDRGLFMRTLTALLFLAAPAAAGDPKLVVKPDAFETLVNPNCSHCVDEAKRRQGRAEGRDDPVLMWTRGKYDGGAIPVRFFLNPYRVISDSYGRVRLRPGRRVRPRVRRVRSTSGSTAGGTASWSCGTRTARSTRA